MSPASAVGAHSHASFGGAEEEKLRAKLESSLEREKALSQRYVPKLLYVQVHTRALHRDPFLLSFEAQLQQWLSPSTVEISSHPSAKKQPIRTRRSAELEHTQLFREEGEDSGGSDNSIRKGLKQLRKKIRLAKYLETKDNIFLHGLVNNPHHLPPPQD